MNVLDFVMITSAVALGIYFGAIFIDHLWRNRR